MGQLNLDLISYIAEFTDVKTLSSIIQSSKESKQVIINKLHRGYFLDLMSPKHILQMPTKYIFTEESLRYISQFRLVHSNAPMEMLADKSFLHPCPLFIPQFRLIHDKFIKTQEYDFVPIERLTANSYPNPNPPLKEIISNKFYFASSNQYFIYFLIINNIINVPEDFLESMPINNILIFIKNNRVQDYILETPQRFIDGEPPKINDAVLKLIIKSNENFADRFLEKYAYELNSYQLIDVMNFNEKFGLYVLDRFSTKFSAYELHKITKINENFAWHVLIELGDKLDIEALADIALRNSEFAKYVFTNFKHIMEDENNNEILCRVLLENDNFWQMSEQFTTDKELHAILPKAVLTIMEKMKDAHEIYELPPIPLSFLFSSVIGIKVYIEEVMDSTSITTLLKEKFNQRFSLINLEAFKGKEYDEDFYDHAIQDVTMAINDCHRFIEESNLQNGTTEYNSCIRGVNNLTLKSIVLMAEYNISYAHNFIANILDVDSINHLEELSIIDQNIVDIANYLEPKMMNIIKIMELFNAKLN